MDEVRTGAPVGQTPPTPPAPPPGPTPTAAKGPPLQLPAPQGGAINVVTDQMAWRLAKLNALATMREFARLGMKVEWNAERPDILERARAAADELYGSIIQTAGQRVKDYFAQQLAEGKAPPDVAKALSEQFRGVSGRQARMVARTVTRQLYNEAALDAYEAAGVREVMASDGHGGLTGKTDKGCLARNGKTFTIAEARLEEHSPTTHPNCTLSWRPVVPDEGLRSEDSVMNAELPANGHRHLLLVWEAEKHPRWPKGTPRVGGEWMDTESVVDLVRMGAPGVRDLSFLARGAQRIRSIHGAERGDGVDLHVELGDGSSHVLHVPRATHWSTVQRAISAVDAAPTSSGAPARPAVEMPGAWPERGLAWQQRWDALPDDQPVWLFHATTPEYADKLLREGSDPATKPRSLARERFEKGEYAEFQPGAGLGSGLSVGRTPWDVSGYGHRLLAVQVPKRWVGVSREQEALGETSPGGALRVNDAVVDHAVPASAFREIDTGGRVPGMEAFDQLNDAPSSAGPAVEGDDMHTAFHDVIGGRVYRGADGDYHYTRSGGKPGGPVTPWNDRVKAAFPNHLDFRNAANEYVRPTILPGSPDQPTVEKTLADIAAGERFRLVTDPTGLYQTFERVTPGESQRGDGRITVRNVDTGKRVHMAPDRRIDHFTREKPLTRMRVADLKPGDRFFVGDRQYELLPQGGSKRKDGRITGREVATGKRVHFKPDREVERRRGPAKPPAPPPPPKPPPRVRKPPAPPPPPPPPDPELPDGYAALPRRGESMQDYLERWNQNPPRLPEGYVFVQIPTGQWERGAKTLTGPEDRWGRGRLYGNIRPKFPSLGTGVTILLVERQRGRETPYMRESTHSFASISRKNVVAAWTENSGNAAQVFYRPPELPDATPKDVKLIKGKRFPLIQIPGNNAHFVIRKGERYQVDQHLPNGETILWPLTAKGDPRRDAPQRVDSMERVTYGLPEQKPVPEELIRSREPLTAQQAAKGELVQLDDGLYYRVTGVKRKGANIGVEMKLANVAGAPVTRVPLDSEVHVVKLVGRDGAVTHAMSLQAGDTFRTVYGRFTVTSVERSDKGVLSIKAQHEDGGAIRSFSAYSRVQLGSEAPTPQGNYFLWQIAEPGGHVQRGIHGYEVIGPETGNTWYAYDVATGKRARLYTYEPEYKPGLPPGEQPLPPKVTIPGTRIRDLAVGDRFTYRGQLYERTSYQPEIVGHRGAIKAAKIVDGQRTRIDPFPDSALVVREGESDPYGPPGPARRAALLAKAREVYRSRRGPQSEDEYRDVGALVHEAMLEAAPGAPGNTAMAAHERGQLRAALAEIRTLAHGGSTSTFRGSGLTQISDHDNNPASVRDPDGVELAEFYESERWFPESWMEQVEDDGGTKIAVGVWRGFYRHGFVASQPEARLIAVSDSKPQVIQHEMGHRVEHAVPIIMSLCTEFWQRRTSGDPTTTLYQGRDEKTKEDHFASKYMGKVYGMRGGGEIFSMGIEDLVHPYSRYPEGQGSRSAVGKYSLLHQDADYAHFMLGLLAALKTDAEVAQIMEEERRLSGE